MKKPSIVFLTLGIVLLVVGILIPTPLNPIHDFKFNTFMFCVFMGVGIYLLIKEIKTYPKLPLNKEMEMSTGETHTETGYDLMIINEDGEEENYKDSSPLAPLGDKKVVIKINEGTNKRMVTLVKVQ